jgi:hypothetical protein
LETTVKIRFETTIEDIVAFNRFHCENSPMWRRQRFVGSIVGPAIFAVVVFSASFVIANKLFAHDDVALTVYGVVTVVLTVPAAILLYFCIQWNFSRNVESAGRKLLAEGSNRSIIGWREMELVNNRLFVKLELIESSYDLRAIEKIVSDDRYTYVYVSSIQAFMIPMTLYPEDEYRQFVAELLDAWDDRDAPGSHGVKPRGSPADERIVEGPV